MCISEVIDISLGNLDSSMCYIQSQRDLTECGSQEKGMANHLSILVLRTYMQVRKQQLELDMEQQTGSKKEKEAVYCHPAYLTYTQSTS